MPQSETEKQNTENGKSLEPHEVGAVAMEMDKILSLAKTDPQAFKQHLIERWKKMEK